MVMSATAQVNARIEPELKRKGDEALAAAGLTPTQAVRALWELATRCAHTPEKLRAALFPCEELQAQTQRDREAQRKRALIEEGANLMERFYRSQGLPWPPPTSELSYEELKEAAYLERYGKEMGWDE